MTDTAIDIAALAEAAAERIERTGLTYSMLAERRDDPDCKVCMLGALADAYFGTPFRGYESDGNGFDSLVEAVAAEVRSTTDTPEGGHTAVYMFNDAWATAPHFKANGYMVDGVHRRTAADAVALLRRVAAKATT